MRRLVALSSTTRTRQAASRSGGAAAPAGPASRQAEPRGEVERAAPARLALDPDPAAHQRDQPRRDGQAQAGAAVLPRRRAVGLREGLEDRLPACRRGMPMPVSRTREVQARPSSVAVVGLDSRRRTTTSPCSVNLMALPTRLTRTCRSRPGSPTSVVGHVGRDVAGQLQPLLRGPAGPGSRMASPRLSRRSKATGSRSSLPASILEKSRMSLMTVSSDSADALTMLQVLALLGGQVGVQGQLGHAEDAVHRRADLVAHVGQELALGPVGGLGRLLGLLQLLLGPLAVGDVVADADDQSVGQAPHRAEGDVDGECRPPFATAVQVQARAHRPRPGIGVELRVVPRVWPPEPLREQGLDGLAEQFAPVVAEHRLGLRVESDDPSRGVGDQDGVRGDSSRSRPSSSASPRSTARAAWTVRSDSASRRSRSTIRDRSRPTSSPEASSAISRTSRARPIPENREGMTAGDGRHPPGDQSRTTRATRSTKDSIPPPEATTRRPSPTRGKRVVKLIHRWPGSAAGPASPSSSS